ncbi:hypothetical protein JX265_003708 [Neoarthrinium moseri]|uniref:SET domain-containing protein n=1 Tax=Neoarthrinium moseri TaxID=1658444 RepID=A0A9Q0ASH0_9PEZI|nr:uncharacterized protein JN550_002453 [Neoarthrinium moseri]KAI1875024.1 hypothetical protein JN550_002453 [Neoarthrinium moseri]KAI1877700.1 hypothetical protein JX265_003708 [Neoarthrinium moseri]
MAMYQVNANCHVNHAGGKGIGLFASQFLSKGLLILADQVILGYETRDEAIQNIVRDCNALDSETKSTFLRLFAGPTDIAPIVRNGTLRQQLMMAPERLRNIARYNAVEGHGTGCAIAFGSSAVNHSCIPNAFLYWNNDRGLMTLYAQQRIEPGTEITINYLQDNIYHTSAQRASRLGT